MMRAWPESPGLCANTPLSFRLATNDENARSALECGSSSYRLPPSVHTPIEQVTVEERR
jgi:hypothetical protein